jgi:hypothetical protein
MGVWGVGGGGTRNAGVFTYLEVRSCGMRT